MLCIKICYLEPEPVGAELLKVEPEPKFFTWSLSRKKKSGARAEKNASAPQHCLVDIKKPLQCFGFFFVDLFGKVTKL